MTDVKTMRVHFRISAFQYFELRALHENISPDSPFSEFARDIITGKIQHPNFTGKNKDLEELFMSRLKALDLMVHYGAAVIASGVMDIQGNRKIAANEELFETLQAQMRGYHYDPKTRVRHPIDFDDPD